MPVFPMINQYDFNVNKIIILLKKPNPNWRMTNINNTDYYVLRFSTSDEAVFKINGKLNNIKMGDLLFFPKNAEQTGYSKYDNPWTFFSVAFDVDFHNKQSEKAFNEIPRLMHCKDIHNFPVLFSELNKTWLGKEVGYLIKCKSILMEILYLTIRKVHLSSHINPQILNIINLIQTNYSVSYSINELAKIAGFSSSYFRVLFKKTTGVTAIQYQNHIKINKAKELLLSGNYNVSEVAEKVGFSNIYYFSELFKNI